MKCKKCAVEITEESAKKVADWLFCDSCFQELFNKTAVEPSQDENVTATADSPQVEPPAPEEKGSLFASSLAGLGKQPAATHRCQMCSAPIEDSEYDSLGDIKFCKSCMGDLKTSFSKVDFNPIPEVEEEPVVEDDTPRDLLGRIHIQSDAETNCSGCGRLIPLGGASELDDMLLCPECYYNKKNEEK